MALSVFLQNMESVQTAYLLKMVQEVSRVEGEDMGDHLAQLAESVITRLPEMDQRMLCFTIDSFEMAGYRQKSLYERLAEALVSEENEDINALARALCCLGSTIGHRKDLLRQLLKKVHKKAHLLDNQGFMDIWMCLGRCGGAGQEEGMFGGKSIAMLKRLALGETGKV